MAAGNVGYSDTRNFSGSLLGDLATAIKNRVQNSAKMAREERAYAEEQAEKQGTSLDEAGVEKGYFFKRALGSNFGGDRIARTRGYFEKNPPMGRDPLGTIESRFRGGFDYGNPEDEVKKTESVSAPESKSPDSPDTTSPVGTSSGDPNFIPTEKVSRKRPLKVRHNKLLVGMVSTFERLEKQLEGITERIGSGNVNAQTVYALQAQKQAVDTAYPLIEDKVKRLREAITKQTNTIGKIANEQLNDAKKESSRKSAFAEETGAEGQNAKADNRGIFRGLQQKFENIKRPGSRLKDTFFGGDMPDFGNRRGPRVRPKGPRSIRPGAADRYARRYGQRAAARRFGNKALQRTAMESGTRMLPRFGQKLVQKTAGRAAAKAAAKGVGKGLIKKVPLLGAVAGIAFGIERALKGDWVGAVGEVASGVASTVPGVGTAVSTAIDVALTAKDINEEMNQPAQFAEGGFFPGYENLDITYQKLSPGENEKAKRAIGAKPLDDKFWFNWHTNQIKGDKKYKRVFSSIAEDGIANYIKRDGGLMEFVDAMKEFCFSGLADLWKNIINTIKDAAGGVFDWAANGLSGLARALGLGGDDGGGGDVDASGNYTGEIKGETFNPMIGGKLGTGSAQVFGASRDGGSRSHAGVDMTEHSAKDSRVPIVAYKTGKVTELSPNANAPGGIVGLDHGDGFKTRYVHVTPVAGIKKGDTIYGGQQLGRLHRYHSGGVEQTHLHFEIYKDGKVLNPKSFIQSVSNNIAEPLSPARAKAAHEDDEKKLAAGEGVPEIPDSPAITPNTELLGKQGVTTNKNFGATKGVGTKGYLIVPGHATGGGAPGEKEIVKKLAKNAYDNIKKKYPDANVQMMDLDSMFEDTDAGFEKQKAWYKKKEGEGYEILEIHMDASMESGYGTGRGVIVPVKELNSVEAHFAKNYGAFDRGFRDLAAPNRGASIFELGNMSPELQNATKSNTVTKQQLDSLTKAFENSVESGLGLSTPTPVPLSSRQQNRRGSGVRNREAVNQIRLSTLD